MSFPIQGSWGRSREPACSIQSGSSVFSVVFGAMVKHRRCLAGGAHSFFVICEGRLGVPVGLVPSATVDAGKII
jgi:hypothetical protein